MKAQNNLRAVICGIAIIPTDRMTMSPHIGIDTVTITANGITIEFNRVQSASFSEKRSESYLCDVTAGIYSADIRS